MRKLLAPSIAILILSATPLAAHARPAGATAPCDASDKFTTLGIDGKKESFAPEPIPSFGHDVPGLAGHPVPYHEESVTRFHYRVDVSGSAAKPNANKATLDLKLSWDNDTEFDIYAYDTKDNLLGKSTKFNPQAGSGEAFTVDAPHCTDVRIDVVNYLGLPTSALVLEAKLTSLKP